MDSWDRGQSLGETLQKTHQGTGHGVASASCQTMMAWGIVGAGRSSASRLVGCDVGYSADMCADSGRYVIGGVTGGILKNSMFIRPTFVISSAIALSFGMGLRGACVPGVMAVIITHTMECPCTIDSCYIMINIVSNILNVASLYNTRYVY